MASTPPNQQVVVELDKSPSDTIREKLDELIVNSQLLAQSLNYEEDDQGKDSDGSESRERILTPARALVNLILGDCDLIQILILTSCIILIGITSLFAPVNSILIGNIFNTAAAYLESRQIEQQVINEDLYLDHVTQLVYGLVGLGFANLFIYWLYGFLFLYLGERIACRVRIKLLSSLLAMPCNKLDSFQGVGGIINKSQRFVEDLQLGVSVVISRIATSFGTITVGIIISFYYSWILTLAILACIPILVAVGFFISPHVKANTLCEKDCNEKSSKHVDWTIKNISTVKLFDAQSIELDKFIKLVDMASHYFNRASFFFGIQQGLITATVLSIFVVGFWLGGFLVHKGSIPLSSVFIVFMNCFTAASNCQLIAPQLVNLERAKVAAVELTQLINIKYDNPKKISKNNVIYPSGQCHGDIIFNRVSFSYPPHQIPILQHVSLRFQPNKHTFIIGSSGSGKSTLGNLLLKLYNVSEGSITVDGIPIPCLPNQWLNENIMLMQQTSIILDGTLRFNLEIGSLGSSTSQSAIDHAVQIALLQELVYDLPDGLDTVLGSDGIELSGGQRQRLAFARAVIRDSPVLILDEFVSALDITQRELIVEAVRKWRHNKTTIFITHELGQIKMDDFVYILNKGIICQQGYRRDLELDPDGAFAYMASKDCKEMTTTTTKIQTQPLIQEKKKLSRCSFGPTRLSANSSFLSFLDHGSTFMSDAWLQNVEEEGSAVATIVRPANRRRPQRIAIGEETSDHTATIDTPTSSKILKSIRAKFSGIFHKNKRNAQKNGMSSREVVTLVRSTIPSLTMVIIGLGITIIHGVITPLFSFGFSHLLTSISEPPSPEATKNGIKWSLVILGLAIADGFAVCLKTFYLFCGGQSWINRLQQEAFQSILLQDMKWFSNAQDNNSGAANIVRSLISEPDEARKLVSVLCATAPGAFAMVCLGLIWAFATGYQLSLVALCMVPVIIFNSSRYAILSEKWNHTTQLAIDSSLSTFHEAVSKYKMVKILSLDRYFNAKYITQCRLIQSIGLKHSFYGGFFNGSVPMISTFTQAVILWYAMKLIFEGSYSYQQAMNVLTMILFSLTVAAGIIGQIPQIGRSKGAAEKLKDLAFLSRNSKESHGDKELHEGGERQKIILDSVYFSYEEEKEENKSSMALSNVSFQIEPGMTLALVGESGSGKSTIASLISKLQFATRGDIKFNNYGLYDLNTNSLRKYMSTVSQTATLFAGTIFDNIAYGLKGDQQSLNISQLEGLIMKAAQRAEIHTFIESLPEGYQTFLDNGEASLSGGQAQRISLARAFVGEPELLILDECTSALDVESARLVRKTITNLKIKENNYYSPTILIITHKREMMELADEIIVLENGHVVEHGQFSQLAPLKSGKLYNILNAGVWE